MKTQMEIPLKAEVECTDGVVGRSAYILINPIIDQVTYLVVKEDSSPNTEYIVPVSFVTETTGDKIHLRCSKADLEKMDPFIKTEVIEEKTRQRDLGSGSIMVGMGQYYYMPYVIPETTVYETVQHKQIPPGELAVRRGTHVKATDGIVGKVDEFVINPENGFITHMVMREGHLWGQKDVAIPLSAIRETRNDIVFLNLDKQQVEALPTFPVHRHWS